jgi:biotin transport system substrate-specific component
MKNKSKAANAAYIGLFAALIAAGAFLKIPLPFVPLTLQTFFAILSGMLLGAKAGALSAGLYVAAGLLGLPIFTLGGGLSYVLQPTFGYLLGLVPGALIAGRLCSGAKTFPRAALGAAAGTAAIYLVGVPYLYIASHAFAAQEMTLRSVLLFGFLSPLPGDLLKIFAAAFLFVRLKKTNLF